MQIYEQLRHAAETVGWKEAEHLHEPDQKFLESLARAIATVNDNVWNGLHYEAQFWADRAAVAVNELKSIAIPDGYVERDPKEPEPKKEEKKTTTATSTTSGKKSNGVVDAIRKTLIQHPDWTNLHVKEFLATHDWPGVKLETVQVNAGDIRRVIQLARGMGYWNNHEVVEGDKVETK